MLNEKRKQLLSSAPVMKAIVVMALPVVVGNIITVLYNLTDTFFIGQLDDPNQLAASALVFPLFMLLGAFGNLFGIGGSSYISRMLGAGRQDEAEKTLSKALFACLLMGIVIVLFGVFASNGIVKMLGASENTQSFAYQYASIIMYGAPFIMLSNAMVAMLRAEGMAVHAMGGMVLSTVVNIALDPLLILTANMQIQGAALATIIGSMTGFIYYVVIYITKSSFKISLKGLFRGNKVYWEILKIGIPAALNQILMSVANIIYNNIAGKYGDNFVAGIGTAMRIDSIVILVMLGICVGTQPLIGYAYGANNMKRLKEVVKKNMILVLTLSTVLTVIIYFCSEYMIGMFTKEKEIIALGATTLQALIIARPILGIFFITNNMVQAEGRAVLALAFSVTRQGVLLIATLYLFDYLWGMNGVIYSQPSTDAVMSAVALVVLIADLKRLGKLEKKRTLDAQNVIK